MTDYDEWRVVKRASQKIRYETIIKMINKIAISKDCALDIGCGNGYFATKIGQYFKKIIAIDIDSTKIQRCKQRFNNENVLFFKQDFITDEIECNQLDLITALEMIFYLPQEYWDSFFSKCKKLLKPNGLFVFSMNILTSDGDKNRYKKVIEEIKKDFNVFKVCKIHRKVYYKIEMPLLYFINSVEYIEKVKLFYSNDWKSKSYSNNCVVDRLLKSDFFFQKVIVIFLKLVAEFLLRSKLLYRLLTFFSSLFAPKKTFSQIVLYCKPKL